MIHNRISFFVPIYFLILFIGCSHTSQVKVNVSNDIFSDFENLNLITLPEKKVKFIAKNLNSESYKSTLLQELNSKIDETREITDSLRNLYNNLTTLKKRITIEQSKEYIKYIKADLNRVATSKNDLILRLKISNTGTLTSLVENICYEYKSKILKTSKIELLLSPGSYAVVEDTLPNFSDTSNINIKTISVEVLDFAKLKEIERRLKDIETSLAELELEYQSMCTQIKNILDKHYTIPLIKIMGQNLKDMNVNSIKLFPPCDTTITCPTGSVLFFYTYNQEKCYQWFVPVKSKVQTVNITKDNTNPLIK